MSGDFQVCLSLLQVLTSFPRVLRGYGGHIYVSTVYVLKLESKWTTVCVYTLPDAGMITMIEIRYPIRLLIHLLSMVEWIIYRIYDTIIYGN